jgi:hypothetical protein
MNTRMPPVLVPHYRKELAAARQKFAARDLLASWRHLERAHIIGQAYPVAHSAVHLRMLAFGIQIKSTREILGQIPRLLVGGVKSFVGRIPVGNTGGADVPALQSMPIPADLSAVLALAPARNPSSLPLL